MKHLLCLFLCVCAFSAECLADLPNDSTSTSSDKKIELKRHLPVGSNVGPSRAPSIDDVALELIYHVESEELYFVDNNEDNITFVILDESNTYNLFTGICEFDENGIYTVSLNSLSSGVYIIRLTINGTNYYGMIEK